MGIQVLSVVSGRVICVSTHLTVVEYESVKEPSASAVARVVLLGIVVMVGAEVVVMVLLLELVGTGWAAGSTGGSAGAAGGFTAGSATG